MSKKRKNEDPPTEPTSGKTSSSSSSSSSSSVPPPAKRSKRGKAQDYERLVHSIQTPIYHLLTSQDTHLFHYTYYPQLKDQIAFLRDGYLSFVHHLEQNSDLNEYVKPHLNKKPPQLFLGSNSNHGGGNSTSSSLAPDVMFCEIVNIKYSYCNVLGNDVAFTLRTLKLKILDIPLPSSSSSSPSGSDNSSENNGGESSSLSTYHGKLRKLVGTEFELDYIDHSACMANYMILKQLYDCAVQYLRLNKLRKHQVIHTSFDNSYHEGRVARIGPRDDSKPHSLWENVLVKWQDGSSTDSRVSVWEIREVVGDVVNSKNDKGVSIDDTDLSLKLGIPLMDRDLCTMLEKAFMDFINSERFRKIPLYKLSDPYPLLLAFVVERLKHRFYRHVEHFESDLRHIVKTIGRGSNEASKVLKSFASQDIEPILTKFASSSGKSSTTSSSSASSGGGGGGTSSSSGSSSSSKIKLKKTTSDVPMDFVLDDDDLNSSLLNLTSKQAKSSKEKETSKLSKKEKAKVDKEGKEKKKEKVEQSEKEGKEKKKKSESAKKEAKASPSSDKAKKKESKKDASSKKEAKSSGDKQAKASKSKSKQSESSSIPSQEPVIVPGQLRRPVVTDVPPTDHEHVIDRISQFSGHSVQKSVLTNILPKIPKIPKRKPEEKSQATTTGGSSKIQPETISFESDEVLTNDDLRFQTTPEKKKTTTKKDKTPKQTISGPAPVETKTEAQPVNGEESTPEQQTKSKEKKSKKSKERQSSKEREPKQKESREHEVEERKESKGEKKLKDKDKKSRKEKKVKRERSETSSTEVKLKIKVTDPNSTASEPTTTVVSMVTEPLSHQPPSDPFDGGFSNFEDNGPVLVAPSILEEQKEMMINDRVDQQYQYLPHPQQDERVLPPAPSDPVLPPKSPIAAIAPVMEQPMIQEQQQPAQRQQKQPRKSKKPSSTAEPSRSHARTAEVPPRALETITAPPPPIKRNLFNFSLNLPKQKAMIDVVDQPMEDIFEEDDEQTLETTSTESQMNEIRVELRPGDAPNLIRVEMSSNLTHIDPVQKQQYIKWQQSLENWQQKYSKDESSLKISSDYELREEPILSQQLPLYKSSVSLITAVDYTSYLNSEYFHPMRKLTNSTHSSNALHCFTFHKNMDRVGPSMPNLAIYSFCIALEDVDHENRMMDDENEILSQTSSQQVDVVINCQMNEPKRLKLHSLHYDVVEAVRISSNPTLMFHHPHPERLATLRDQYGFLIADGFKWYSEGFYYRSQKGTIVAQTKCSMIDIVCIQRTVDISFSLPGQSVPYQFHL